MGASPDGQERRVGRTWTHGTQHVAQYFAYDDQLHIAAELDAQNNVVSTFVYGMRPNVPDAMVRGANTYRILSDWRGSVRAVVDANTGTVVQTIDYDAWGNPTVNDTSCATGAVCALFQPFGFAGGLYDRETGLVRFGARDYDAVSGRWTQKDASRFEGGTNFYAYAGNDPTNFYDPDGLFSVACAAAGAFGEGVAGAAADFSRQAFNAAQNSFCGGNTSINWGEVAGAGALGALSGALGGACFEPGTLVATCSDGDQPIETLKGGDTVLSRSEATGETECKAIVRTYVHDADDVVRLSVSFDDGRQDTFDVTLGHPFWVSGKGWTSVRDLVRGDVLATAAGTERVVVDGWVAEPGTERVFNLEVEGDHSYFVGPDGVWVHNDCRRGSTIAQNAAKGRAYEAEQMSLLRASESEVQGQVSVTPYTASGDLADYNVRLDAMSRSDGLNLYDSKSSSTAGFTTNQSAGYPLLAQYGGVVAGNNGGASYPAGFVIPPTSVTIIRP